AGVDAGGGAGASAGVDADGATSGAQFHLTLDDLQWADDDTLELLTLLANRGSLRILGAFRRYETTVRLERAMSALGSAARLKVVELEPLNEAHLRHLLATLMGTAE